MMVTRTLRALVAASALVVVSGQSSMPTDLIVTRSCQSGRTKFTELDAKFGKLEDASKLFTTEVRFSTFAKILNLDEAQLQKSDVDLMHELESLMLAKIGNSVLSCARLSMLLPQRENIDDVIEITIESEFAGEVTFPDPESPCYTSGEGEMHKCQIMHSQVRMSFLNPYDEFQLQYEVLQSIKQSVEDDDYVVPSDARVLHVGYLGPDPKIIKLEAASLKDADTGVHHLVGLTLFLCFGMMAFVAFTVYQRRDLFFGRGEEKMEEEREASSCIEDLKLMREWNYERPACTEMAQQSEPRKQTQDDETFQRKSSFDHHDVSNRVAFRDPSRDEEDEILFCVDRSGGVELTEHLEVGEEEISESPMFESVYGPDSTLI
jgi:hypothetical protein